MASPRKQRRRADPKLHDHLLPQRRLQEREIPARQPADVFRLERPDERAAGRLHDLGDHSCGPRARKRDGDRDALQHDAGSPDGALGSGCQQQVTLKWLAAANTSGSAITGYTVTSNPLGKTCTTTGALTCTVTGLTNGTLYTFTVTASNANGAGPPSAGITATAGFANTAPAAPTAVTASMLPGEMRASAQFSWVAPTSNGGSAITGYTVTLTPGGLTCTTTGALSCSISKVVPGTTYAIAVTATNGNGIGAAGTGTLVTPALPSAPTGVVAKPGNGQVALSWQAPASTGGVPILSYMTIYYLNGAYKSASYPPGNAQTSSVWSNLTNGQAAGFTISAITLAGRGPESAW